MLNFTEHIKGNRDGKLCVEGIECTELANRFGTPLFVFSENQLSANIRRFRKAFEIYPSQVVTCIGMKANYGLAIRRVIAQEDCGGDAFGCGELYAALITGTDQKKSL